MSRREPLPPTFPEDVPTEIAWHSPQQEAPTIWMAQPWRPPPQGSSPPPALPPPAPSPAPTAPQIWQVASLWLALGLLVGWTLYG